MKSSTTKSFRDSLASLPPPLQAQARKNYRLWLRDHWHPSLHFKKTARFWSARIGSDHRALGVEKDGTIYWARICSHDEYERQIRK